LKLTASDALELGLIDRIVPEPGEGAHADPDGAASAAGEALREALEELSRMSPEELIEDRYRKFRRMGPPSLESGQS
jgi:acetyl-CoA carboxylase carboxyl transferase subunit alpha